MKKAIAIVLMLVGLNSYSQDSICDSTSYKSDTVALIMLVTDTLKSNVAVYKKGYEITENETCYIKTMPNSNYMLYSTYQVSSSIYDEKFNRIKTYTHG